MVSPVVMVLEAAAVPQYNKLPAVSVSKIPICVTVPQFAVAVGNVMIAELVAELPVTVNAIV